MRKNGNDLEQLDNAVVLDFGAKGQYAAFKVPNNNDKTGKSGYHGRICNIWERPIWKKYL